MNLIINNIEFDHADIFDDIKSIKKQFHNLIKIIPCSEILFILKMMKIVTT